MGFLGEDYVRHRARMATKKVGLSSRELLRHQTTARLDRYDVFLSQAIKDEELVLGVYSMLTEDIGLRVFCDWIETSRSDHAATTSADADHIRRVMAVSTALLFIDSESANVSTWMSWEIGWFHGAKRRVCVLPIVRNEEDPYRGREFLGLYPAVEEDDRFVLRVPAPRAKLAARLVPGTPLGLATWMPFEYWATTEMLPDLYLA
ncbi:hypothetical protein FY134_27180 (plasmid) [Agrobacterium fabrum]|uniref:hypothetical protein n=1 Tax=Agrobacterium fabrum TaxID=1176649 RepID=UPI0021D297ED|nr:hypothetical protein [Agrobacterium fabrum]UXT61383.1 hypothetical protein FY134_27180 [Agrobacterium fabrum]